MGGLQGRVIGGYRLADQLTSGGIAEVYRAQPSTPGGREAVVKVIYPEFVGQPGFRARFEQIVQMAQRLSHPHILPLLGSGEQNGYLYLITPYVAAGTLRDWIRNGRHLGAHDVAPFFRQACEATSYAHSLSVLHGNLKPSNIFVHEGRHVLIGDFGRLWDPSQIDMSHAGPGTEAVEYLAPEAIEGSPDQRSDIYSLGAVLFASLTGRAPYTGTTPFEIVTKHRQHPVPHLGDISPAPAATVLPLDEVVQRAMAKSPEARYPSALALAQSIETTLRSAAARVAPSMMSAASARGGSGPFGNNGLDAGGYFQPGAPGGLPASMAGGFGPMSGAAPLGGGGASLLSGLVDPSMEEGRLAVSEPGANGSHILPLSPLLSSAALPSQPGAPDWNGIAAPIGRPGTPGSTNEFDFPALPTARVPAPPSPLPPLAAQGAADADLALEATSRVPAEPSAASEPSPGALPAGFIVKGGAAAWPPQSPDMVNGAAAYSPSDLMPPLGDLPDIGSLPRRDAHDDRPFSATQLGLPRLTSPDLGEIPPSWRELASSAVGVPGDAYGSPSREDVPDRWADMPAWHASGPLDESSHPGAEDRERWSTSDGWGAESGQWADSRGGQDQQRDDQWADSRSYSHSYGQADGYSESMPGVTSGNHVPDLFASSSLTALEAPPRGRSRRGARANGSRFSSDDDDNDLPDDPFADPSAWAGARDAGYHGGLTRKGKSVRYRQPRMRRGAPRARSLFLFLLLFAIVDGTLVVILRPDLCPSNRCAPIHRIIAHYVPALNLIVGPAATISATPQKVTIQVAAGASQHADVVLKNSGTATIAWAESSDLKWLSATPSSGTLNPAGTITVTLTVNPPGDTKPGPYTSAATITVGAASLTVPVTITVSAAQH